MNDYLENIQAKISEVSQIPYIDEDWGQLDEYGPNSPVKWPCCLIDVSTVDYSDTGLDRNLVPQNRQEGSARVILTFANLKLTNTSFKAPQLQKDNAWLLHHLVELVHGKIHAWSPVALSGKLIRKSFRRVKRDDGIQQYEVVYAIKFQNV